MMMMMVVMMMVMMLIVAPISYTVRVVMGPLGESCFAHYVLFRYIDRPFGDKIFDM